MRVWQAAFDSLPSQFLFLFLFLRIRELIKVEFQVYTVKHKKYNGRVIHSKILL